MGPYKLGRCITLPPGCVVPTQGDGDTPAWRGSSGVGADGAEAASMVSKMGDVPVGLGLYEMGLA